MKSLFNLLMIYLWLLQISCCTGQSGAKETGQPATPSYAIPDSVVQELKKQKAEIAGQMSDAQITYFVTNVADGKFGYMILIDGKIYIDQKDIPAMEGHHGFATKEDAEKIALLVIEKMKQGEMPPSITVEELKERGIK